MVGRSKQRLYHTFPPSQNVTVRPPDPYPPPQGLKPLPHTIGTEHLTHSRALHSSLDPYHRTTHETSHGVRLQHAIGPSHDQAVTKFQGP